MTIMITPRPTVSQAVLRIEAWRTSVREVDNAVLHETSPNDSNSSFPTDAGPPDQIRIAPSPVKGNISLVWRFHARFV